MIEWILAWVLCAHAEAAGAALSEALRERHRDPLAQALVEVELGARPAARQAAQSGEPSSLAVRVPDRPARVAAPVVLRPTVVLNEGARDLWRQAGLDEAPTGAAPGRSSAWSLPSSATGSGTAAPALTITPFVELTDGEPVRFYEVTLKGATFTEEFLLHVPTKPPVGAASASEPAPLVVLFHGFGKTHWDAWVNTEFIQECQRRGWYLVCPLGATNMSFGSPLATQNRELVLDWLQAVFPRIDGERVYGIGFSMGGGALLNYAARHLDPQRYAFAALVNHTGGIDLNHTYANDPGSHVALNFWYGNGSPSSADAWLMARSSVLRADPVTLVVQPEWDLARNLVDVPLRSVRASHEPIGYLAVQNDVLAQHMATLGASAFEYHLVPSSEHAWSLIDEAETLDWLAPFRRAVPSSGSLLADGDQTYHHFAVEQDAAGAFSPFSYALDAGANELVLDGSSNIARVVVDTLGAGLDPTQALFVELEAADGLPDEIVLRGWAQAPLGVLRDGLPESAWTHDPVGRQLVLHEYDPGRHRWEIQP